VQNIHDESAAELVVDAAKAVGGEEDGGSRVDFERLVVIFEELTTMKNDAQQRSWSSSDDAGVISEYLEEFISVVEDANPREVVDAVTQFQSPGMVRCAFFRHKFTLEDTIGPHAWYGGGSSPCEGGLVDLEDDVWTYEGNTADGRPYYSNRAAMFGIGGGTLYHYYDANCNGKECPACSSAPPAVDQCVGWRA
jgi:hypothetical protein